jgi:Tol biopolymer transport system component
MARRTVIHAALLALLALAGTLATAARATQPAERNGEIAYQRYRFTNDPLWAEIYVSHADGTGARKLTHAPRGFVDGTPDWSPDGAQVVFQRCPPENGPGVCSIWLVAADGSGARRLSPRCAATPPSCANEANPAFTPDGRHVVFVRDTGPLKPDPDGGDAIRTSTVVRMDTAGGDRHVLARIDGYAGTFAAPSLSPDGARLVYVRWNSSFGRPKGGRAAFVADADGTRPRRLTSWRLKIGDRFDWAPDGSRLLFRGGAGADVGRGQGNLFTIRPDGSGLRQLTHFRQVFGALTMGSWSPDGRSIVFSTTIGARTSVGADLPDVFIMAANGTSIRPVTRARNWDGSPDWGPQRSS